MFKTNYMPDDITSKPFGIKHDSIASISQEILIRNEKRDVSTKGVYIINFTMHIRYVYIRRS